MPEQRSTKSQAVINAEMQLALQNLEKDVQEILRMLKGNGKVGLMDRVSAIENDMQVLRERHKNEDRRKDIEEQSRKEFWQKIAAGIILMVVSNIGLILTVVYKLINLP